MAPNPYNDLRYLVIKAQYHLKLMHFWRDTLDYYKQPCFVYVPPNVIKCTERKMYYHRSRFYKFVRENKHD